MPDIVPKVNYLPQISSVEGTSVSLYRDYTKPSDYIDAHILASSIRQTARFCSFDIKFVCYKKAASC